MTDTVAVEEDYDAGDKCGRCGCARRDHTPACTNHPSCKRISAMKDTRPKPKKRR